MKKFIFIFLGFFISLNIYANGCGGEYQAATGTCRIIGPDGKVILYNSTPPQSGSGTTPQKIIRHTTINIPSKYGALASNNKLGAVGGAINMNSLDEAKREAIRRCENGGRYAPCKIITWVRNGCFAGAANSKNKLYRAVGEPGSAEQIAMSRCKASGVSGCEIVIPEACSIP